MTRPQHFLENPRQRWLIEQFLRAVLPSNPRSPRGTNPGLAAFMPCKEGERQDAGPQDRRAAKKTNPQADSILLYGLLCGPAAWRLGVKMQTVVARPAGPATDSQSLPAIPTRSKRIGVDFLASRTGSVSASTSDCQQDQGSQGINQW